MKKLFSLLTILVLITSCTGDQGPPGIQGNDGAPVVSKAFEIALDFNAANNYEFFEAYGFDVFPADVTLVYILWETVDGQDIWRLLPQSVQFDQGNLVYNFDFTQTDVRFFLDGTINFAGLDASYTQNQIFRVVVVPADNVGRLDTRDLDLVMSAYGIESFEKR